MAEALLGYPLHAYLAIGHLEQAEEELLAEHPLEAGYVREERVKYMDELEFTVSNDQLQLACGYGIDTVEILRRLTMLTIPTEEKPKRKKTTA